MPRRSKKSYTKKETWKLHHNSNANTPLEDTNEISVRASYSQSDSRFSSFSRGAQCVPNSLVFLAHLYEMQEMDRGKLNHVLTIGDELYSQIRCRLEARRQFVSRHLNFDDVPDTIEMNGQHYTVIKSTPECGFLLQDAPEDMDNYLNLTLRLETLGNTYSQALLIVGAVCISVFKDTHGRYGFFDPHSRSANGECFEEDGKAVMVTFNTVSALANRLIQLFYISLELKEDQQYDLLPLRFERVTHEEVSGVGCEEDVSQCVTAAPEVLKKLGKLQKKRAANKLKRVNMEQNAQQIQKRKRKEMEKTKHRSDSDKRYRLHSSDKKDYLCTRYSMDTELRLKKNLRDKDNYKKNAAFQLKKRLQMRDTYRNNPTSQQRHKEKCKQHMTDRYKYDLAFQQRHKQQMRDCYRKDLAFQQRHKQQMRDYYRKDLAFHQRHKQQMRDYYRKDLAFQQRHKQHMRDCYRKDLAFQQRHKQHVRDCYRKDLAFQQRHKQHVRDCYRKDLAFQQRHKQHVRDCYRKDLAFQQRHKQHVRDYYRKDLPFQQRHNQQVRDYYRKDLAFQQRRKQQMRDYYRKDLAFQHIHKQQMRDYYRKDLAFQQRRKQQMRDYYRKNTAHLRETFKTRYGQDATFHYAHSMVYGRHFKLRRTSDLKALHSIRCSNQIKNKYWNIMHFGINRIQNTPNPLMKQAQTLFELNVKQGPTYICNVCHRCLFPNQVRRCDPSKYSKDPELATMCFTNTYDHACEDSCQDECRTPERKQKWICHSCHENLKSGHLPPIAVANNLELAPIPGELQGLNVLERHVIAKFIPFAKIISLPKGQQRAVHGAVVCVPSEVDSTVESLPRPPSEAQLLRVKLKRRLQYKSHFQFQSLDMRKVQTALLKLKEIHSEYRDISLREATTEEYLETTEVAPGEDTENVDNGCNNGEQCPETTSDGENAPVEQDDSVAQQYGIVFDSCLQPADVAQELLSFGDNIYSIAPAEGNQPVSFFKTPKLESMAFPVQFNTGKNTYDEPDRPKKISPSRYFNARLFSVDNRFAMDTNYIFFSQFVTEMHLAMSSMSIQLRKGKVLTKDGRRITTSLLKDQCEVEKLVRHGEATRFMQPLRGTPAFWEKTMKDLFACLRQLGLPTFFCTFSAAEMRWPEIIQAIKQQQGETVNFDDLDWMTKCEILRSNPVTVIRMFEKRVEALMRDLILSPAQPIGEVLDMFYRVEFQARGSPHIHCLFWIKDAPRFDVDDDEKIVAFIDQYISCQLPEEHMDPELHSIVKEVQSHSRNHTKSCKKGNKHCRFGFPKPPVRSSFITRPCEPEEDEPNPKVRARARLKSVWDLLQDPAASLSNTEDILAKCNMTHEEFHSYLHSMTDGSAVIMKRDPKDCWTNPYNPELLRAWNANMDIQFILNPYSCIMYMLSYITKAEHEMSEYLKSIVKDPGHQNASDIDQMKQIMQAYSKNREVSVQEAVTRVSSLKLKSCSRSVIFIPTDDNALKMSLPRRQLESRDPDSDNVWMTGLPEKYKARPQTQEFETMCLADFASNYRLVYGRQRDGKNVIPLQDNMGFIYKRTKGKPAVIRYAHFSQNKDPEKFYGSLLKVFLPYRTEHQLKMPPFNSYQRFYESACVRLPGTELTQPVSQIVQSNKSRYEKESDAVERAIEDFLEKGPMEDAWASFAPNSELLRIEDRQQMDEDDEQDDVPEYTPNKSADKTGVPLVECPVLSSRVLREMYQSLNQTQAAVFYKIRDWALKLVNGERPDQFFYFVTGGAGTGKSHLIKCIYSETTKILRRLPAMREQDDISKPTVLLSSFTGTAAFNISGNTLHSLLKLPKNLKPPYQGLGNSLDEVRIILSHVQVIVIDEISMVSKELFAYVDLRLQQIKGNKKPFGGVSVLAVGDFFQLPPVGKAKALCIHEDNMVDIWQDRFQIITLTEIMRQKEDSAFAEMLNRLRVKKKTESLLDSDRALLTTRIFSSKDDCPPDVLHIFATNKQVDQHNNEAMTTLSLSVTHVDAEDYAKDDRTGRMIKQAVPFKGSKGDLPDSLLLSEGARIVITRNLDVTDGLVNGTFGKISKIISKMDENGKPYVDSIALDLDNPTAGVKNRNKTPGNGDNAVYISRVEERCKKRGQVRLQFPLKLAFACTSHKVQGMTSSSAVVSLNRVFEPGMAYVALSRTTSLQGLHIIEFEENKIYCNEDVLTSLESMPKADIGIIMPLLMHTKTAANGRLTLIHHNIEGLDCHFDDLKNHHEMCLGDILCLTETHMFGSAVREELQLEGYRMYRRNRQVSYSSFPQLANQKGGGIAIYVKNYVSAQVLQYVVGVTDMEFLALKIRDPIQAVVAAIYRPPNYKTTDFLSNLGNLLDAIEIIDQDNIIICGDFNEDSTSASVKPIKTFFTQKGYTQVIQGTTTDKNTALDLIFVSQPQNCLTTGILHSYYSYHRPVYAVLQ